jgi:isopenicillin N synthase-like dioxygenase
MSYAEARHIEATAIPVIDMRADRTAVSADLLAAAEATGFFYVRDPAVPQALIDAVFSISREFFALPIETKRAVSVNAWHRGFIRAGEAKMEGNAKPDLKESFIWGLDTTVGDAPVGGIPPNRWPDIPANMRKTLNAYFDACNAAGWRLLRAFAASIGAPEDAFVRTIDRPTSRGSLIYYPPQPPDMGENQFGVSPHTDFGCLTLLYQDDVGGLQVRAADGAWVTAHPILGTFVVNVGDLLARWTNDRFKSTPHRVVNRSGRERFSVAVFVDPNAETVIDPVVAPGENSRYAPVTAEQYIKSRFDAAFAYRQAKKPAP